MNRIWDESGKPYQPTMSEAIGKGFGFASSRRSTIQERTYESKKVVADYAEKRQNIARAYRGYLLDPGRTQEQMNEILGSIKEYNDGVLANKKQALVPLITGKSLKRAVKEMSVPNKRERALLQAVE